MCQELDCHFDWQWNVHPWSKQGNPGTAIRHYLAPALVGGSITPEERALEWMRYGLTHRWHEAASLFTQCFDRGAMHVLVSSVTSSGGRRVDWAALTDHLTWQAHFHPLSLLPIAKPHDMPMDGRLIASAYRLLEGQSHNPSALQLYRGCLASDPGKVGVLAERVLAEAQRCQHPYVVGCEPDPLVTVDVVPPQERT